MGYDGEILNVCPAGLDFSTVYAVVVSGAMLNPCGHALLFVPTTDGISSDDGYYFQVAQAYGYPRYMQTAGYARYLSSNGKTELTRYAVTIPRPNDSYMKLVSLMGKKWVWGVLPNNCAAFVEDVVRAGGSSAGLYSNCPSRERFE